VVSEIAFALPGDLATPTGGYAYDRRLLAELDALGWRVELVMLGDGFPQPSISTRREARGRLAALRSGRPIIVDGLALGVLPEAAAELAVTQKLIALVHHPLALETGLSPASAAALRDSERTALGHAHHVVATSATTARVLVENYSVPQARLTVIEPGTDQVATSRRDRSAEPAGLAVGAVVPRKGYDILVAALARIVDLPWHFVIAGACDRDPATTLRLRTDIFRHGLEARIDLVGEVSPARLSHLYVTADLFVLPSRFEGYGMAFAEAVAHGLPVIGTTAGAIPETVSADAAILVPPDDIDALERALRRLIASQAERDILATGARAAAARLPTWHECGLRFSELLARIA
jgi:glycosyltransferase involved in cell wall biosynthesis